MKVGIRKYLAKKFPDVTKYDAIFTLVTLFILSIVSSFYVFVLVNPDALKEFIQANATILGFFGLLAVYWLTSMDSRIDRFEQEKHEYEKELTAIRTDSVEVAKPTPSKIIALESGIKSLEKQIGRIETTKERIVNEISAIGVLLIIPLFINIGLLAFQSSYVNALTSLKFPYFQIAGFIAAVPLIMFFESVWFIFLLLRRMGKKPKEKELEIRGILHNNSEMNLLTAPVLRSRMRFLHNISQLLFLVYDFR
jgi:hypothetical protein